MALGLVTAPLREGGTSAEHREGTLSHCGEVIEAGSECAFYTMRSYLEDSKGPSRYSVRGCFFWQLLLLWKKEPLKFHVPQKGPALVLYVCGVGVGAVRGQRKKPLTCGRIHLPSRHCLAGEAESYCEAIEGPGDPAASLWLHWSGHADWGWSHCFHGVPTAVGILHPMPSCLPADDLLEYLSNQAATCQCDWCSLILVASEAFEDDSCNNFVSEDDSETQSVSSFSSGPTSPSEMSGQFPAAPRPGNLDLPSPVSLSEFGMMFPVLGPRSECSGASSPECEVERGECKWSHQGAPGLCTQICAILGPCQVSEPPVCVTASLPVQSELVSEIPTPMPVPLALLLTSSSEVQRGLCVSWQQFPPPVRPRAVLIPSCYEDENFHL